MIKSSDALPSSRRAYLRELEELNQLRTERARRQTARKARLIDSFYPDDGPFRRELYPKHLEFFALGRVERERAAIGGNRTGKTNGLGGYETTRHLLGDYPEWWNGRTYEGPVDWWAAGDTTQTTRDTVQKALLGPPTNWGSGLIPAERIKRITRKSGGVPDAVESVEVAHRSGGTSILGFKSYDQGRRSFQGTFKHGVWFDEEPPWLVYEEGLLRITDTEGGTQGGIVLCTFTPLLGMSDVVLYFLGDEDEHEGKDEAVVQIGMRDVPHISAEERERILGKLPQHQRKAREYGIPSLGAGAIYPFDEEAITFHAFEYPRHWVRGYGFDVGWKATAAVFCAYDRDQDIVRVIDEYKAGENLPAVHASAIKARGDWQPGVIDPASKGHSPNDGKRLVDLYRKEGMQIKLAERQQREAGILECVNRFSTGRLLIAEHCVKTLAELRVYRRNEKGQVVKKKDHLMDAMRYRVLDLAGMRLPSPKRIRYVGSRG